MSILWLMMAFRRGSDSAHRLRGLCALLLLLAGVLVAGPASSSPDAVAGTATVTDTRPVSANASPGQYAPPSQYASPSQYAPPGQYASPSQYATSGQDAPWEQVPTRCSGTLPSPDPALVPAPTPDPGHAPPPSAVYAWYVPTFGPVLQSAQLGWPDRPAATLSELSILRI